MINSILTTELVNHQPGPNDFPLRMDVWGEEFEALYSRLEQEGKGRKTVKAQHLWLPGQNGDRRLQCTKTKHGG